MPIYSRPICLRHRREPRGTPDVHAFGGIDADSPSLHLVRLMTALRRSVNPFEFVCSTIGLVGVLLTLPVVIAVSAPMSGWAIGAALWVASWIGALFIAKFAVGLDGPQAIGISGMSFMVRAWIVFGILFVVAAKYDKDAGVTAAAVFMAGFTLDLMGRTMLHALHSKQAAHEVAE